VLTQAVDHSYDVGEWQVVPNALLVEDPPVPDAAARARLRTDGPVRILARLGPEKGVSTLLAAAPHQLRRTEVALAAAGFDADSRARTRS
jgi:hypothetical protein